MDWKPATESGVTVAKGSEQNPELQALSAGPAALGRPSPQGTAVKSPAKQELVIGIGKRQVASDNDGKTAEVFTMTLGNETIELLPLRNWGQLDVYKWRVQGKLPGTPAGLEITSQHIKIAGETVSIGDPEACEKLGKLFNEWLALEQKSIELARKKVPARPGQSPTGPTGAPQKQPLRFRVEVDKRGQVHIHCLQGAEILTSAGLTIPGLAGLASQGLMRKPRHLEVGALHDWIELDGELCSFEHGNNDAAKLEKLLNDKYVPLATAGQGKDILIFANPASPTGFDIQFPVTVGGVQENRRRTLNDATLELLQEPVRCGLLQPGLILKISPPTLIIKQKTADGGEAYLEKNEAHTVLLVGDDGRQRSVDLSQPVNYSHLSVVELTAVLNHPAINRHSRTQPAARNEQIEPATLASCTPPPLIEPPAPAKAIPAPIIAHQEKKELLQEQTQTAPQIAPENSAKPAEPQPPPKAAAATTRSPNAWLKDILEKPAIRHDWLSCLLYRKIAEHFGNSNEENLQLGRCWAVFLGENREVGDLQCAVVFLTQKGGLGFVGRGRLARFHKGVVFVGTPESVLEGIDVHLVGVGLFGINHIVFIVRDEFRSKFGVTESILAQELKQLSKAGASLLTVREVLEASTALETVWSAPADQPDPADPQGFEHTAPIAGQEREPQDE